MPDCKIYFCGSIRGGRQDAELYDRLITKLKKYGTVLTEHVAHTTGDEKELTSKQIYERDMDWMRQCNVIVAEVTQPSLGVGFEIGSALAMKKKILCLYRENTNKALSCMIAGAHNGDDFIVQYYTEEQTDEIFTQFFREQS